MKSFYEEIVLSVYSPLRKSANAAYFLI